MSLIALALRMAAKRAVETAGILPEGRVYDSNFLPVDQIAAGALEPFLIFSTETITGKPSGRDLSAGERTIEFVMELGITKAISVSVPDGDTQIEVAMVESDAGLEASLALLERQIMSCLFGRGGGEWGDAFRRLCAQISETASRRGVGAKDGVRFCARQTTLLVSPIAEPAFAAPVDERSPLAGFLAQATEDDATAAIARAMRAAIEGVPQDWPTIFTASAVLGGYTEEEAASLGFALVEPDDDPESVDAILIEDDDGGVIVVDANAVSAHLPEEQTP